MQEDKHPPVVSGTSLQEEVSDKYGNAVTIYYRRPTKRMRDHALMVAAYEFKKAVGEEGGVMYGVFDREMVNQMVLRWEGLPMPVKETWHQISPEMGDAIVKALCIRDILTGAIEGAAVEKAKNSSGPFSEGAESGLKE